MPFIGNQPALSYTSFAKQDFSTSATTSYTLDNPVANANELALFINFVRQEPTTAYSASGTTLTLTSATASSDDMYCVYLGKAVQTVNPPNASVGLSQLTATGTKDATTFLRGDNTFASAGGANTPAFRVSLSGNQSMTAGSQTKIQFNTEDFDTDNAYDNSTNYRFTPQTAGKYFIYLGVRYDHSSGNPNLYNSSIYKNGSTFQSTYHGQIGSDIGHYSSSITINTIVTLNGSTDYIEAYGRQSGTTGSVMTTASFFGGYKLIGV
jgi:hypothetical protein